MLFNSYPYIFLFLPIVAIIYYVLTKQRLITMSKAWLVLASIFFYNWWNPKYTPILLFSIIFNFAIGSSFNSINPKTKWHKKSILIFGIVVNLLILGYYKYMDFFIQNLNIIFHTNLPLFKIILPLGISFFTFQQITYIIDSYRGETKEYDFLNYALFVSFFPQLIAGPIVYHKEIMPQFMSLRTKILSHKNLILGIFLFVIGLFKKVVLADTFSGYVNTGFHLDNITMLEGWISSLSYTFQIYFDFSGYCDMAMGSALLFNIKLPLNFNSPYKSESIQEFWNRWHITLSRFLKNWVYFPLGGSQISNKRTYINTMITFLVSGLWHGAAWTFVIWGALHGICLCINRFWKKFNIVIPKWINILITFLAINAMWILFRAETFSQAKKVFLSLFDFGNLVIPKTYNLTLRFKNAGTITDYNDAILFLILGIILIFVSKNSIELISNIKFNTKKKAFLFGAVFALIFIICIIKMTLIPYTEFIYFNF